MILGFLLIKVLLKGWDVCVCGGGGGGGIQRRPLGDSVREETNPHRCSHSCNQSVNCKLHSNLSESRYH